jgi:hypothetical protein
MSQSSSPKKNSITSLAEYDRLSELYREANDRIQSGGTGAGWSGIHYDVMFAIRSYGKVANGREEAVRILKQLLTEYEKAGLTSETTLVNSTIYSFRQQK